MERSRGGRSPHRPGFPSPQGTFTRRTLVRTAFGGVLAAPMAADALAQGTPVPPPLAAPTPIALTSAETWEEPWIWRPSDWPGQRFTLNVIENEIPGVIVGFGNPSAVLFSYNGGTPGPTIRMRGDEVLLVTLRNLLGQDYGTTPFGPYPDMAGYPV